MRCVLEANHAAEAHMLVHYLESHDIHAHIEGQYLSGAIGQSPAHNFIRVMVKEDDYEAARRLIDELDKSQPPPSKQQDFWNEKDKAGFEISPVAYFFLGLALGAFFFYLAFKGQCIGI